MKLTASLFLKLEMPLSIEEVLELYTQDWRRSSREKLGLMIAGGGAVLTGAGYVLLGAGVVSVAVGVGGCVYVGAGKAWEYRQVKRCEVKAPLFLTEGGDNEFGTDRQGGT